MRTVTKEDVSSLQAASHVSLAEPSTLQSPGHVKRVNAVQALSREASSRIAFNRNGTRLSIVLPCTALLGMR